MAVAPAAGEAPVLGYIAIGLLACAGWLVFLGLRFGWSHTFGALLTAMANVKIDLGWFGSVHPLGFLNDANRAVLNALQYGIDHSEHAMGYMFHGAAVIQGWIARELVGLARDTLAWADWIQHAHLPRWLKAAIYAAIPPLLIARLVRAAVAAELPHLTRVTIKRIGISRKTLAGLLAAAIAVAFPGAIRPWALRHRLGKLERDTTSLWKRVGRLEKLLGATSAALLVARALGLSSARCIRSGNIGRAARRFCGLDNLLVDALLADLAFTVGAISIVELAKVLQKVAPLTAASLVVLVEEIPISAAEAEAIGKRTLATLESIG
jgi:hypothetical protein